MAPTKSVDVPRSRFDDVAWQFLASEFAGDIYVAWPIDRRLDAFLRRRGYRGLRDDGSAYEALLDRVMANIGAAMRAGVLPDQTSGGWS
ncbi:MAG: hypothetical protein SW019_03615 [Actinomycetota bacterium]|nr:hypothetical protein [Actinomycetota bacterium]